MSNQTFLKENPIYAFGEKLPTVKVHKIEVGTNDTADDPMSLSLIHI